MVNVMRVIRPVVLGMALLAWPGSLVMAQAPQGPAATAAQDEYVPIAELPESEKLPAAPFIIGAYTFAWVAILVYLLMLWRRLGRVQQELQDARRASGSR